MIDTKLLRQKILDLAIRGKLVPQDPNDEPASELLKKIKAEKEALIKAGKLKRDKHESLIFQGDDKRYYEQVDGKTTDITGEIPFDLPDGWAWCRIGNFCQVKGGKRIPKGEKLLDSPTTHVYLRVTDMKDGSICDKGNKYISESVFQAISNYTISKHDLYLTIAGTIGLVGIIPEKFDGMSLTENAAKLTNIRIHKLFLGKILTARYFQNIFSSKRTQVAQPKLALERIISILFPLPPLDEQKRIVAQIESLLKCVDEVDRESETLEKSIALAKQKILDLAIRGKLVPQDPNDEPAFGLLKKIKAEKEALIKAGKLKRDKHESFIIRGDDNCYHENIDGKITDITREIPFELPKKWMWSRLLSVILPTGSKNPKGVFFDYIDIDAINNLCQEIISAKHLRVKDAPSRASREVREGDTLFSLVRPYLKNIAFVSDKYADCIASTGFYVCRPADGIDNRYLFWLMISDYTVNGINSHIKGDNSPSVRKEDIDNFMVPIPPLSEQKRIVSQVEKLFAVLETMRG